VRDSLEPREETDVTITQTSTPPATVHDGLYPEITLVLCRACSLALTEINTRLVKETLDEELREINNKSYVK